VLRVRGAADLADFTAWSRAYSEVSVSQVRRIAMDLAPEVDAQTMLE
jgi:hypothetical protein